MALKCSPSLGGGHFVCKERPSIHQIFLSVSTIGESPIKQIPSLGTWEEEIPHSVIKVKGETSKRERNGENSHH